MAIDKTEEEEELRAGTCDIVRRQIHGESCEYFWIITLLPLISLHHPAFAVCCQGLIFNPLLLIYQMYIFLHAVQFYIRDFRQQRNRVFPLMLIQYCYFLTVVGSVLIFIIFITPPAVNKISYCNPHSEIFVDIFCLHILFFLH